MRVRGLRRPLVACVAVCVALVALVVVVTSGGRDARQGSPSAHEAERSTVAGADDDASGAPVPPAPADQDQGEAVPAEPSVDPSADPADPALAPTPVDVVELPPVGLDEVAEFGTGVRARVVSAERVDGQARGPGERSGPALAITVELVNETSAAVSLDHVVVNLADAESGRPGSWITGDPRTAHFSGDLLAAESRVGVYVIRLPDPDVDEVRVDVSYGAQAPTVVFSGEVSA